MCTVFTVTLIATDIDGPSNITSTSYTVDGWPDRIYTDPFVVSGTGTHTIQFGSVDQVGNVESPRPSQTVNILQIATTASGLIYSRLSQAFIGTMTITNTGNGPINGQVQIAFTSLPSGVVLKNATGSFNGDPTIIVPGVTSLEKGQSASISVQFQASPSTRITFAPVVYSGSF